MDLIKAFTNEQLKAEVPSFSIGDTVRVENKIKEGNRERKDLPPAFPERCGHYRHSRR